MDFYTGIQSIKIRQLSAIMLCSILLTVNDALCADQHRLRVEYVQSITEISSSGSGQSIWRRLGEFIQRKQSTALRQPMGVDARNGMLVITDASLGGIFLINFSDETTRFMRNENTDETLIPVDAAVAENEVFVTYSNSPAIDVFDFDGNFLRTIIVESNATRFTGIGWSTSNLFVVDTPHHTVIQIDETGQILKKFQPNQNNPHALNFPTFVTVDRGMILHIADTMNFRVLTFSIEGDEISAIGTAGVEAGQFNRPKGVAVDQNGNIYVVDSSFDNVQVFAPTGHLLTFFGKNGPKPLQFRMPTDIAIDGDKLYVSDTLNRRVQVFRISYE